MIHISVKGDYKKTMRYLEKASSRIGNASFLNKYGKRGVTALSSATPLDTGKTSQMWSYDVKKTNRGVELTFYNSAQNDGVHIAIILQYGHGTGTGGWVEGRDYINPAIQPIFDQIAEEAWKEVSSL